MFLSFKQNDNRSYLIVSITSSYLTGVSIKTGDLAEENSSQGSKIFSKLTKNQLSLC